MVNIAKSLVIGTGDGVVEEEARKTAAMHALLQLVAEDMIDPVAQPKQRAIHEKRQAMAETQANAKALQSIPISAPDLSGSITPPTSQAPGQSDTPALDPHAPPTSSNGQPAYSSGVSGISIGMAREFIDWYCKKFAFGRPDLAYKSTPISGGRMQQWTAILSVNKKSVGLGRGPTKKLAAEASYTDSCSWLSQCDPALWQQYLTSQLQAKEAEAKRDLIVKSFPRTDFTPSLDIQFSDKLDERIRDVVWDMRSSELYRKAVLLIADQEQKIKAVRLARAAKAKVGSTWGGAESLTNSTTAPVYTYARDVSAKSSELRVRLLDYRDDHRQQKMRDTRASLPVYAHSEDLLQAVEANPVIILMAQTGSGKTTQVPQIILDDWIEKGKGGQCNVVCTQPRRLAAISVAQRIANERGEQIGESVGYQVRFDSKLPAPDGSILFCTTGIFLKRFQLSSSDTDHQSFLEDVTHVVVDEVSTF